MRRVWMLCASCVLTTTVAWGATVRAHPTAAHPKHAAKAHHAPKATAHHASKGKGNHASKRRHARTGAKHQGRGATVGFAPQHMATLSSSSSAIALFGDQAVEPNGDSNSAGTAEIFPFSGHTAGTANAVSLYVDSHSTAHTVLVALYTDAGGRPGAQLTTGSLSSPHTAAWNTLPIRATAVTATGR
jgi:hypothetical protein